MSTSLRLFPCLVFQVLTRIIKCKITVSHPTDGWRFVYFFKIKIVISCFSNSYVHPQVHSHLDLLLACAYHQLEDRLVAKRCLMLCGDWDLGSKQGILTVAALLTALQSPPARTGSSAMYNLSTTTCTLVFETLSWHVPWKYMRAVAFSKSCCKLTYINKPKALYRRPKSSN